MRLLLCLAIFSIAYAQNGHFTPPSGWEVAQLKKPTPEIKVCYVGKGSSDFRPSINFATEEVDVPLKEYVKAVKEIQKGDPKIKWRDLGKFPMKGGVGHLIEMTQANPRGEIKILQAYLVVDQMAYILTASVAKEELSKFQGEILKSFASLTVQNQIEGEHE